MRETSFGERPLTPLEMSMTITSMLIGVGILSLPRALAKETVAFDGWMSIVLAGGVAMLLGMLVTKTALRTGGQPFLEYASSLISRPLACVLAVLQGIYFWVFAATRQERLRTYPNSICLIEHRWNMCRSRLF